MGMCVSLALPLAAQERRIDPVLETVTRGVDVGSPIRFMNDAGEKHLGSFRGIEQAALLYQDDQGTPGRISTRALAELSTRRRAWRKGVWILGSAGAAVGVFGGVVLNAACESGQGCTGSDGPKYALVGAILGGLTGGAIGALIGSAFTEWHVLYAR